jgi:site-specific recombinase XerD
MLLQKRNNSYYFRYSFPPLIRIILGRQELCKSLYTSNKLIAQSKAARYFAFVATIKDIYSKVSDLTPLQFKKLIQEALDNLEADLDMIRGRECSLEAQEGINSEVRTLEEYWNPADQEFNVAPPEVFVRLVNSEGYEGENIETMLSHWDHVFVKSGVVRSKFSHQTQWRILEDLLKVYYPWLLEKYHVIEEKLRSTHNSGPHRRRPSVGLPDYVSRPEKEVSVQNITQIKRVKKISSSSPPLSKVYKEFLQYKPTLTLEYIRGYDGYLEVLIALVGDKAVDEITKKHLKNALSRVEELPRKNCKPYNKMSWSELIDIEVPEEDFISRKTVTEHLKFWQSLFAYVMSETEYLEVSPTANLKYKVDTGKNSYAALTDREVRGILEGSKSSDKYWWHILCSLAAYTGARKSELLALKPSDFKKDDDTGRDYFHISDSKTDAGIRNVPVAECICNEVMGYVNKISNDEYLFPVGRTKEKLLVGWVRGHLTEMGNSLVNDHGNRKVFHSFRHSFVTKVLAEGNELSLVQSVIGHEKSNSGQTQRYTHQFPIKSLLCVVDCIVY